MPVFLYRALDTKGRAHEDEIVAESAAAAREMLRGRGLYPVEVRDDRPGRGVFSPLPFLSGGERFPLAELASFTRQFATLLNAGMQIVPALSVLVREGRAKSARRLLVRIREAVNEGATLARAMGSYPRAFSTLYVSMVRAGESSGALAPILARLADYLELQQNLRRRLTGALAYPVLMVLVGFSVVVFMLSFVVPSVVQIFRQARQDLPWPTRMLISGSDFLNTYVGVFLAAIAILGVTGVAWRRTEAGRWFFDSAKLRLPLLGGLIHKLAIARFGRTLGILLAAGLPILEALSVARHVIANRVLESAVEQAREETRKGRSLSGALERSGLFPPIFTDMVAVGEQSGSLDAMLIQVSQHIERESESTIQTMMTLMEPILILAMAVAVGFVVVAILLPLFEVSQLIR